VAAAVRRKFVGDPKFLLEIRGIEADHAMQPLSTEETAKLATPVTRPFSPLHTHEEDCWGEPFKRSIYAPGRTMKVIVVTVQQCRRGGAIREVKDAT
jgi:hypothetical protein